MMNRQAGVGLVAGRGRLPFDALQEIKSRGYRAVVVGLAGEVDPEIAQKADDFQLLPAGKLGSIIETFHRQAVKEVVFAGKVGKEALFQGGFDPLCQALLASLPQKNDDAVLLAIVEAFEKQGIHVAKQTDYLRHLLAPAGMRLGEISAVENGDLQLGFRMAKVSGELDIGQSVIVKNGVVLAVEAIEGTDQAILRGGTLGGPGAVVVKVSKPKQDERFDVPTVGLSTLQSMITARAGVLGIEAAKTLIVAKEEFLDLAARHGLKIVAL
ncbi:LpxI family protein [Hydrogenispora ethanolica]|nr:UDP-2,3-diacylglucosamine diphosphatase LpxI [Hydrogenispora ethanolica]